MIPPAARALAQVALAVQALVRAHMVRDAPDNRHRSDTAATGALHAGGVQGDGEPVPNERGFELPADAGK